MNVQLFIPCFVDQLYPGTAFNMIKVLEKAGCTVTYNTAQTCCGQPAFNSGYHAEAIELAQRFLKVFRNSEYIVAPSGSCTSMVKMFYPEILEDPGLHELFPQ